MICEFNINSGQKRLNGVPAKSAADSVSQGGFPLEHQSLKGAKPSAGRGLGTQPAGFSAGCRALFMPAKLSPDQLA